MYLWSGLVETACRKTLLRVRVFTSNPSTRMFDSQGACVGVEPETRQPQSQALKTLQEVLSWKPTNEQLLHSLTSCAKNFVRPTEQRKKPYTLVCHDFKGGYLEDRYLQGGRKEDAYYFCRWECIDMFVYFSHHFVTVPPLGWTRAAHKHKTIILGTIITEWKDGEALWTIVLGSKETLHQLVANLVAICKYHDFDGWLVNVENKIEESQVAALKDFVELLTKESHRQLPGSKVLWYDSVTRKGDLKWQDELNEENSMFFDACDGIFLNYCWTPEKLAASKETAKEKGRPFDVFVGIDVFGRGCPGGGGFNTREALHHARENNLSAAVFAPGWVLETLGVADFEDNDCRFWAKLHDLCPPSGASTLPLSSAFCQGHGDAFFCMGEEMTGRPWYNMSLQQRQPERTRVYGFEDPTAQATQPSLNTCLSSAYLGGCSVELSAHLTRPLQTVSFRLFSIKSKLDETLYCSYTYKENSDAPCDVYLVLTFGSGLLTRRAIMGPVQESPKGLEKELSHSLAEGTGNGCEPPLKRSRTESGTRTETGTRTDTGTVYVGPMREEELEPVKSSLWFHDLQETNRSRGREGWITRHFRVDTTKVTPSASSSGEEAISVSVSLSRPLAASSSSVDQSEGNGAGELHQDIQRTSILLGHLQVFRERDLKLEAPEVTNIKLKKMEPLLISDPTEASEASKDSSDKKGNGNFTNHLSEPSYFIQWDVEGDSGVDYFNVYMMAGDTPVLIGHTATNSFVTTVAAKFVHDDRVTVTVQPVLSATGLPPVLSKCAKETLLLSEKA